MGIFERISTILKSNINDLIGRAEDPEKMLNQLITDMRGQLAKAKQEVASAIADEKKLNAHVEKEKSSAAEWEQRAIMAVEQNRDDMAKQALVRHNEHMEHGQSLHETWARQKAEVESLKASLRQLNEKIEEAKRKKNLLVARQKRAAAQTRIQETMSSLSDKSAFESFDRMTEKIEEAERKALAATELSEDLERDDLSREFTALEIGSGSADQQLLELKKKMGMLPSGDGEDAKQLSAGDNEGIDEGEIVEEEGAS
ncbi:MAG: PspA/IM30 family protein [Gemmatimonadetes bacterium]|nr:PspA/IM30 family protein [Gemmatimonadota bacterium]